MHIYTDAVIADLEEKLEAGQMSICVKRANKVDARSRGSNDETYPSVTVYEEIDAVPNLASYSVVNGQGETVLRNFDENAYPFMWGVSFFVAAASESEAESIADFICSAYRDGVMLKAPSRLDASESIPVFVRTDEAKIERGDFAWENVQAGAFETYYSVGVPTNPYLTPKPLLVSEGYLQDAKTDPAYQLELLRVLVGGKDVAKKASNAAGTFKEQFGYVSNPKPGFFSSALNGSSDLKSMRQAYQGGLPVDRSTFEKTFADAVELCPDLYERAMRREPMDAMLEAIRASGETSDLGHRRLFNALGIPEQNEKLSGKTYSPREASALRFYIEVMEANAGMTVYQAIKAHLVKLQESDERSEAIANALVGAVAAKAVDSFTKPRQGGSGFGGGKKEKPDLIGSRGCDIAEGRYKSCYSSCRLYTQCGHHR